MILLALLIAVAAPGPAEIEAAAPPAAWRSIAPENLLIMETAVGSMVIELAPDFAPAHVAAIRALVAAGRFDGGAITRVQDNYVIQWAARPAAAAPKPAGLPAEYERSARGLAITALGSPDAYAEAGFSNGWPVAQDRAAKTAWLAHCYAMVGVGRDVPPDTGDGSELYAVIGHAPRHLDRNISLVGRVIEGLPEHTALKRGTEALGVYKTPAEYTAIVRIRIADATSPRFEVMDTASASFAAYKHARANRADGFFIRPAGAVDLCNVRVPIRRVMAK